MRTTPPDPTDARGGAGHARRRHPRRRPRRPRRSTPSAGSWGRARSRPRRGATPRWWRGRGGHGALERVGVEGAGSYGLGLVRWLRARGVAVVEVERPKRQLRARRGSPTPSTPRRPPAPCWPARPPGSPRRATGRWRCSGPCGWPASRRSRPAPRPPTSSGRWWSPPPTRSGPACAPSPGARWSAAAAGLRTPAVPRTVADATRLALRSVARRHQALDREVAALDAQLGPLVAAAAPGLVAVKGVGTDTAGALLTAAGDNPERLRGEAAFARLCGVAPLPASSGKTVRHRLNPAGTGTPTGPCTCSSSGACAGTPPPAPTSPGAPPRAGPCPRSCAA